ncbi:MAG: hypothetical protein K0S53_2748 [Bacteroidetes bacterium]|nr:hypothetical protein [Bacteroidota bacterium]MDF2451563.1 hypothetical protein [Bacteroidota bacterium]
MFDKEKYKKTALNILSPIKTADIESWKKQKVIFKSEKSLLSFKLPEYYLVYFLFAELLDFHNLGQFEKVAWSFPIDYKGKAFIIEYRKFGMTLLVQDLDNIEQEAEELTKKLNGAVTSARPFYDYLAEQAVKSSQFNVTNRNSELFGRFNFLLSLYKKEYNKYIKNKGKIEKKTKMTKIGEVTSFIRPEYKYQEKANWIAISCIEAFYSWTEHLFIHLAIVAQNLSDGVQVSKLIEAEWKTKFKAAVPYESEEANRFYVDLLIIRQQLRNFVAHGSFGKDGNAFKFHSNTGTIPVIMSHNRNKNRFSLHGGLTFKEDNVIKLIEDFIKFLWSSPLLSAPLHL